MVDLSSMIFKILVSIIARMRMPSQQIYTYHPSSLGEDRRRSWKKGRQRIKIGNEEQQKCHEMTALRASEPRRRSRNVMKWWHYYILYYEEDEEDKDSVFSFFVFHVSRSSSYSSSFSHVKKSCMKKNIFEKNYFPLTKIRPTQMSGGISIEGPPQMSGISALYGSNQPYRNSRKRTLSTTRFVGL